MPNFINQFSAFQSGRAVTYHTDVKFKENPKNNIRTVAEQSEPRGIKTKLVRGRRRVSNQGNRPISLNVLPT